MSKNIKDQFTGNMFKRLLAPSLISSLGLALGDMADAVVVGREMGAVGLAAISLSLPIYMIINVGMHGLGLGGSARYSKYLGEGNKEAAVENFNRILQAAVLISIALAILGSIMLTPILKLLGIVYTDGELYNATREYVGIIIPGMPAFFIAYIINYYLRNDDNQKLAGIGFTIANLVDIALNIFLVIVLHMGAMGAAISTIAGQIVAIAIYLPAILHKKGILRFKRCTPDCSEVANCFKTGFSTAVRYIWQMVFLLIMNNVLIRMAGETGVAVFDMIQNASYMILYMYEGTAKAMQPLISTYFGEQNLTGMKETLKKAVFCGGMAGSAVIALMCIFPEFVCGFFGLSETKEVLLGTEALRIYCIGAFVGGLSLLLEGYYQAGESEKSAFMLTTLRGMAVLIPCTLIFSFMGLRLFWWIFPVTEISSLILFFVWQRMRGAEKNFDREKIYSKTIENRNEDLAELTLEIESFCERWNANIRQKYFVTMTVEEICLVIMEKAFSKNAAGHIQITLIALEDGDFELHIRDSAVSFNPFSLSAKKINEDGDCDLDGVGMLVIRQKAKSFFYRKYQGYNSLVVRI